MTSTSTHGAEHSEEHSLRRLAEQYTDLGRHVVSYRRPDDVFPVLTREGLRCVPGAEHAGITRLHREKLETVGATGDLVEETDALQYALASGPCVDAVLEASVFRAADLRRDARWPEFGRRAAETTGVLSMLSIRLFLEDDTHAAGINFYATRTGAFDDSSEAVAMLLATHAALAVAHARAQERGDHLERALDNSRDIGVAMGILMQKHTVTRDQAFSLLRISSQHRNRKLADVAMRVADTGELDLGAGDGALDPGRLHARTSSVT